MSLFFMEEQAVFPVRIENLFRGDSSCLDAKLFAASGKIGIPGDIEVRALKAVGRSLFGMINH
jgi:hypothetical protein